MCKKIIPSVVIFAMILQLIGCSNIRVITKDELIKEYNKNGIIVFAKNDSVYSLLSSTVVVYDTIHGRGYVKSYSDSDFSNPFAGKIALDDIWEIRKEEIHLSQYAVLGIGILVVLLVVVAAKVADGMGVFK